VIDQFELDNGLVACVSPNRSIPIVAVSLWYRVGSADEVAGRTGLAHLFEHLMFQGSRHVGKGEHFTLIQSVGGRANAATGLDRTFYYERLPSQHLELALWLEAERLAHLADGLDSSTLDNQRDVVRNERRSRIDNQPYGDAEERLQSLLYPADHPYAHDVIGSMDDLAAASLDDVRAFFSTFYAPANAVLAVVGDFEVPSAMRMVQRHFGGLPAGKPAPPRTTPAAIPRAVSTRVVGAVSLPRCYLTYPIPSLGSSAWDAGEVVADLLGRGRASRLYANLVRSELAQSANAWTYPLVDDPARLTIDVTARADGNTDELTAAVLHEVERLGEGGPSGPELDRVRNLRRTEHATDMERSQARADRIGMYASLLGTPDSVDEEVARYEAVGNDDVRDFVAGYLRHDRAARLTYVPEAGR